MPRIFRQLLGFTLLVATVGLATCQSMLKAEPNIVNNPSSLNEDE